MRVTLPIVRVPQRMGCLFLYSRQGETMSQPSNRDDDSPQREPFFDYSLFGYLLSVVLSPVGFMAIGVGCGFAAAMFEENARRYGTVSGAACGFAVAAGLCAVAAAIVHVGRRRSD